MGAMFDDFISPTTLIVIRCALREGSEQKWQFSSCNPDLQDNTAYLVERN